MKRTITRNSLIPEANLVLQDTVERIFVGVDEKSHVSSYNLSPTSPASKPPSSSSKLHSGFDSNRQFPDGAPNAPQAASARTSASQADSLRLGSNDSSFHFRNETGDSPSVFESGHQKQPPEVPDTSFQDKGDGTHALSETKPSDKLHPLIDSTQSPRPPLMYGDIPRGVFVIRGENVVLLAEIDPDAPAVPPGTRRVSPREILTLQREELEARKKADLIKRKREQSKASSGDSPASNGDDFFADDEPLIGKSDGMASPPSLISPDTPRQEVNNYFSREKMVEIPSKESNSVVSITKAPVTPLQLESRTGGSIQHPLEQVVEPGAVTARSSQFVPGAAPQLVINDKQTGTILNFLTNKSPIQKSQSLTTRHEEPGTVPPPISVATTQAPPPGPMKEADLKVLMLAGPVLSMTAGYINVTGMYSVTVAHHSGNITKIADAIFILDFGNTVLLTGIVCAFFLGAMASGYLTGDNKFKIGRSYGATLLLESFFLLLSWGLLGALKNSGTLCASFAMGVQNAMATQYSGAVLRTTHVTGTLTDIGNILGQAIRGEKNNMWKLKILIPLLFGYFLGGIIGRAFYLFLNENALLIPTGVTGTVAVYYLSSGYVREARDSLIKFQQQRLAKQSLASPHPESGFHHINKLRRKLVMAGLNPNTSNNGSSDSRSSSVEEFEVNVLVTLPDGSRRIVRKQFYERLGEHGEDRFARVRGKRPSEVENEIEEFLKQLEAAGAVVESAPNTGENQSPLMQGHGNWPEANEEWGSSGVVKRNDYY
ncbi:hypothetical protein HDU93_007041 [Gonapodya sp. JEL0774]|nr:hypothetical protein HDU93_007041 [Gonapodya sp. JEL0774]